MIPAQASRPVQRTAPRSLPQGRLQTPPPRQQRPLAATSSALLPPSTHLHPQVYLLFERLLGVIRVMHSLQTRHTTLRFAAPTLKAATFYQARGEIDMVQPPAVQIALHLPSAAAYDLIAAGREDLLSAFASHHLQIEHLSLQTTSQR